MRVSSVLKLFVLITMVGCGVEEKSSELNSVENLIVDGSISNRFLFDQAHINNYSWKTQNERTVGDPNFYRPINSLGIGSVFGLLPREPSAAESFVTAFGVSSGDRLPRVKIKHSAPGNADQGQNRLSLIGSDMRVRGLGGTNFLFDLHHPLFNADDLKNLREAGVTRVNLSAKLSAAHVHLTQNDPSDVYIRISCHNGLLGSRRVLNEKKLSSTTNNIDLEVGVVDFDITKCITPPSSVSNAQFVWIDARVKSIDAIFYEYTPIITTIR
ncbi:MAG: hypothetical protein HRU19_11285 [Pseudobacteriovorax sp.]|nr:hypothetical protein [Pseudobacteriovorax sp.]